MPAWAATYRFEVSLEPGQTGAYTLTHSVQIPIGDPDRGGMHGEVQLRHEAGPGDAPATWGGAVSVAAGALEAFAAHGLDHRSSPDPFRLVHKSARTPQAWAVGLEWSGSWSAAFQYAEAAPLRGRTGPLVTARVQGPGAWPRLTWAGYGTEVLQHHFYVLDGRVQVTPAAQVAWGGAWQEGLEAPAGQPGFVAVREAAAFARLDARAGRHRIWLTAHGTTAGFRSLAADSYPFARGRAGLEGRWQFRPRVNHLLSVYAEHLEPLGPEFGRSQDFELRYSVTPRGRWAWLTGVRLSWSGEGGPGATWVAGLRDPGRRLDASVEWEIAGDGARLRPRVEWQAEEWRLLVAADTAYPGWRAQWAYTGHSLWELVVVYKERWLHGTIPERRGWTHVQVVRRFPEFGEVWVRWNEWDQGRLDVGWTRPATIAAGIAVFF